MRVLHVIHGYADEFSGGAENYVRATVAEQRRRGLDAVVLTGSMHPWEHCGIEEIEVDGARVLRLHRNDFFFDVHSKGYHPGVERVFGEALDRERPDLIHVHQWIRLTSNLVEIAHRRGIPAVITLHDVYTSCPRAFRVDRDGRPCSRPLTVESCLDCVPRYGHEPAVELAEGISLHRDQLQSELALARAVVVASPRTGDVICRTTGFPEGRFTTLPMGYSRRFAAIPPAPAPLPADGVPFRFGYWGHLTRHKGVQVLLEALGLLMERSPPRPVEVHLLGQPDTEQLRDELHELAQGRPVVFRGAYDTEMLAGAGLHMAVFPSLAFETFGYVFDEAVELGLPVITSDLGAIPERAGDAALTFAPADTAALADTLARVLRRPELRDELATRLPQLPPTLEQHAAELTALYEGVRTAPPLAEVPAVNPLRRSEFQVRQRESAQGHLHPDCGPS